MHVVDMTCSFLLVRKHSWQSVIATSLSTAVLVSISFLFVSFVSHGQNCAAPVVPAGCSAHHCLSFRRSWSSRSERSRSVKKIRNSNQKGRDTYLQLSVWIYYKFHIIFCRERNWMPQKRKLAVLGCINRPGSRGWQMCLILSVFLLFHYKIGT